MSISSKRTKKAKRMTKKGKELPIKCTNCGAVIDKSIYDMKKPWEYQCTMCGKYALKELYDRIKTNEQFNLGDEIEKLESMNK